MVHGRDVSQVGVRPQSSAPSPAGDEAKGPNSLRGLGENVANIGDHVMSRPQVYLTLTVAGALLGLTLLVHPYRDTQFMGVEAFLPICATLWILADLLTAYLLVTQFAVSGALAFLAVGCSYAVSAFLTVFFLWKFPGIFSAPNTLGDQQISVWLWVVWHVVFPLALCVWFSIDPSFKLRCEKNRTVVLWSTLGIVLALCVGCAAAIIIGREHLPPMVLHGKMLPTFTRLAAPIAAALNFLAVAIILVRARPATALQACLALAVFTAGLDAGQTSIARYTLSWYVGKFETVITATVVLLFLLYEINALYQRLAGMAMYDALTGVRNRRGYDTSREQSLQFARRTHTSLALLVIDVDDFKAYNDRYGHAMGDMVLRRIADTLASVALRSTDVVARYGGEEFVILMNDSSLESLEAVAERVRDSVERLGIPHEGSRAAAVVTVSIGAALAPAVQDVLCADLFTTADCALYAAKSQGRNRCVVSQGFPQAA